MVPVAPDRLAGDATTNIRTAACSKYLSFRLGTESYGMAILQVHEIRSYEPHTRIANFPRFMKGVVNLRGVVVHTVDLRPRFDQPTTYKEITVAIVLNIGKRVIGIVAYAVSDVVALSAEQIGSTPPVNLHHLWFKATMGLYVCETGRDISFWGHAIASDELMVLKDAAADPHFADNPLVLGETHIRFYAGAPLTLPSSHRDVTLCLISRAPRGYDDLDRAIHQALRDLMPEELTSRENPA